MHASRQMSLNMPEVAQDDEVRFLSARLSHAPLEDVYRLLVACERHSRQPRLLILTLSERVGHAPDGPLRRRLCWLLGDMQFRDNGRLVDAIEAYTHALESDSSRPVGFDIACLAARSTCLGRARLSRMAVVDQARIHALVARLRPSKPLAEFLFELAEEQFSDYGLLSLAEGNYGAAGAMFERLGDLRGLAKCEAERGRTHFYRGQFDDALRLFMRARRLWSGLGDWDEVAQVDGDLSEIHYYRRSPQRMLGAATRRYLLERDAALCVDDFSWPLWDRALALKYLGRREERDQAARQAIWALESDIHGAARSLQLDRVRFYRLRLLAWQLDDHDYAAAAETALLLLPGLLERGSSARESFSHLSTTLGRLREVLSGDDLATSLDRAFSSTDCVVPPDCRMVLPEEPVKAFYLGRGLVCN